MGQTPQWAQGEGAPYAHRGSASSGGGRDTPSTGRTRWSTHGALLPPDAYANSLYAGAGDMMRMRHHVHDVQGGRMGRCAKSRPFPTRFPPWPR